MKGERYYFETCVLEHVPDMSEEDQSIVIVGMQYIKSRRLYVAHALGYQSDRLELRCSRDETTIVYSCLRRGWKGFSKDLYDSWSREWVHCVEPERSEQKTRLDVKLEKLMCRLQESQDRELAVGKTVPSLVVAKRVTMDKTNKEFHERKEYKAKYFDWQLDMDECNKQHGESPSPNVELDQRPKAKWGKI